MLIAAFTVAVICGFILGIFAGAKLILRAVANRIANAINDHDALCSVRAYVTRSRGGHGPEGP